MKKIILFFILASAVFAQVETSRSWHSVKSLPEFYFDYAGYKSDNPELTKLDIFLKMPYSNLQFLKKNNVYQASYTVTVSLYDKSDVLIVEKLWNENVVVRNFKQTTSRKSFNISYKTLKVKPGNYKLVCNTEDNESRKYYSYKTKITVPEFNDNLNISDVVLVSQFIETNEGKKVIPNISNMVTSKDTSLMFFYEIYSPVKQTVSVKYELEQDEEIIFTRTKNIQTDSGKTVIYESLKDINFNLGDYVFKMKLLDKQKETIREVTKKIRSKIFGFPSNIKDLDLAIRQMVYIASPDELEELKDEKDFNKKLKKFMAFWKARDPSPGTVENETLNEYYRRVAYANEHFKGFDGGWNSDMGMVYITLGQPDQVIRRPFEIDTKPYEIWDYYSLNRRFIFVDVTNFGDYRLTNYNLGNWFRYRP